MSRKASEEWDRRKRYLVRSLFDNIPLLSPTPEVQESSLCSLAAIFSRPYSPLPELIIEKERKRYDEPEEYYGTMEKKVLKIYRKLFLNRRSVSVEEREPSPFSLDERYNGQNQIVTKAEIHRVGDEENTDSDLGNGQLTDHGEVHSEEVSEFQRGHDALSSHQSESLDEPEIMRRRNSSNRPNYSINVLDHESRFSDELDKEVENVFTREIEMADEPSSHLSTGNVYTSTPTAEVEELEYNQENRRGRRRTLPRMLLDKTVLSPKRIKVNSRATQTSFSSSCEDSTDSWQEIKTQFFVGKQSFYNLCCCKNHICQ